MSAGSAVKLGKTGNHNFLVILLYIYIYLFNIKKKTYIKLAWMCDLEMKDHHHV